jgi:hypothetical protein
MLDTHKEGAVFRILTDEADVVVHAEVQLLVKMRKEGLHDKETYMGVFKLCYLKCHAMLQASDRILSARGVIVIVRGSHNILFKNWVCPDQFKNGFVAEEQPGVIDVNAMIGYCTRKEIEGIKHSAHKTQMRG